jgi:hypothetical protein
MVPLTAPMERRSARFTAASHFPFRAASMYQLAAA